MGARPGQQLVFSPGAVDFAPCSECLPVAPVLTRRSHSRLISCLFTAVHCPCLLLFLQSIGSDGSVKAVGNDFSYLTDLYNGEFPKVVIQLPMYNEDAHCDLIIQRCCKVKWPSHRLLIQVGVRDRENNMRRCNGGCGALMSNSGGMQ